MSTNLGELMSEGLEEDLVVRQRQALLGSLAGIIAHEYSNLMTPVLARAQDAIARDDPAAMAKALATTVKQTQSALGFTRQLIELAHGRGLSEEDCSVADLVDQTVLSAVRPFKKDGIELDLRIPVDLRIRARPLLFKQVMLNLLLNARKAMKGRCGKLSVAASPDGETIDIAVCDCGEGMSQQTLDEVINPFLSADADARPGDWSSVGLGLHACRLIAQLHGATIRAHANDGPGCTFRLGWPAA